MEHLKEVIGKKVTIYTVSEGFLCEQQVTLKDVTLMDENLVITYRGYKQKKDREMVIHNDTPCAIYKGWVVLNTKAGFVLHNTTVDYVKSYVRVDKDTNTYLLRVINSLALETIYLKEI